MSKDRYTRKMDGVVNSGSEIDEMSDIDEMSEMSEIMDELRRFSPETFDLPELPKTPEGSYNVEMIEDTVRGLVALQAELYAAEMRDKPASMSVDMPVNFEEIELLGLKVTITRNTKVNAAGMEKEFLCLYYDDIETGEYKVIESVKDGNRYYIQDEISDITALKLIAELSKAYKLKIEVVNFVLDDDNVIGFTVDSDEHGTGFEIEYDDTPLCIVTEEQNGEEKYVIQDQDNLSPRDFEILFKLADMFGVQNIEFSYRERDIFVPIEMIPDALKLLPQATAINSLLFKKGAVNFGVMKDFLNSMQTIGIIIDVRFDRTNHYSLIENDEEEEVKTNELLEAITEIHSYFINIRGVVGEQSIDFTIKNQDETERVINAKFDNDKIIIDAEQDDIETIKLFAELSKIMDVRVVFKSFVLDEENHSVTIDYNKLYPESIDFTINYALPTPEGNDIEYRGFTIESRKTEDKITQTIVGDDIDAVDLGIFFKFADEFRANQVSFKDYDEGLDVEDIPGDFDYMSEDTSITSMLLENVKASGFTKFLQKIKPNEQLKELHFIRSNVSMGALTSFMQGNNNITALSLVQDRIDQNKLQRLLTTTMECSNLKDLSIGADNIKIGSNVVLGMVDYMTQHPSLCSFHLTGLDGARIGWTR